MTRTLLAMTAMTLLLSASAQALEPQHYWVYCINDKTSVEQWDLEQMRVRHGRNVCLLYEDTSSSGAQTWMEKNFPTKTCYCHR